MKPWSLKDDDGPTPEVMEAMHAAGLAIVNASEDLPEVEDMILFDLQTGVSTRFVAMPVYHRHGQDCARA